MFVLGKAIAISCPVPVVDIAVSSTVTTVVIDINHCPQMSHLFSFLVWLHLGEYIFDADSSRNSVSSAAIVSACHPNLDAHSTKSGNGSLRLGANCVRDSQEPHDATAAELRDC